MRKIGIVLAALAVVALPATALAKPSKSDRRHASKECRAERTAMGDENFKAAYRNFGKCVSKTAREEKTERTQARSQAVKDCKAAGNKGRDLGKCVRQNAKENKGEADAEDRAERNAAKDCRGEQEEIGDDAFAEKYGTNRNKRNAFGKCVSGQAKDHGDDDADDDSDETGKPDRGKPDHVGADDEDADEDEGEDSDEDLDEDESEDIDSYGY